MTIVTRMRCVLGRPNLPAYGNDCVTYRDIFIDDGKGYVDRVEAYIGRVFQRSRQSCQDELVPTSPTATSDYNVGQSCGMLE